MKSQLELKQEDILFTAKMFVNSYVSELFIHAGYLMNSTYQSKTTLRIELSWVYSYSCLYISPTTILNGNSKYYDLEKFQFLGRNELLIGNYEDCTIINQFCVTVATRMENELLDRYKGVFEWKNSYTFCSVPGCCKNNIAMPCITIGNKHVCENCIDKFSLTVNNDQPAKTKKEKTERSKMSTRIRYDILERDGFKCNYCGAKPEIGNNVKLHVDHIIPVSKGGKTETDNLQVLCQTCNLGKSDKMPKYNNSF